MKIITGRFKGRRLQGVPSKGIRPATERAKGVIFNSLQNRLNINGARVLDLFAGSGNLGFEALSRGAAYVLFVDDSESALALVEGNAGVLNCVDACGIVEMDAFSFVERCRDRFDLIFADPPYACDRTADLPRMIFEKNLLKKDGFLIIEHDKHTSFDPSALYRLAVRKGFGSTHLSFFVHPSCEGG